MSDRPRYRYRGNRRAVSKPAAPTLRVSPTLVAQLVTFSILGPFAMHLVVPALPDITQEFRITEAVANQLISVTLIAIAATTLCLGPFADRYGRKPILVLGLSMFVIGSVMAVLAEDIWLAIAGRAIQGAGGATGIMLGRAMAQDIWGRDRATTVIAYLVLAVMIAPIMAPVIAGPLVDIFGWRAVFVLGLIIGLVVLGWLGPTMPETLKDPVALPGVRSLLGTYREVMSSAHFWAYACTSTFLMAAFFISMGGMPYVAFEVWGVKATELAIYWPWGGAGMAVGTFMTAQLSMRIGPNRLMLWGVLACFAAVLLPPALLLAGWWSPWAVFGPPVLSGFGAGMCMPSSTAAVIGLKPGYAGTASGLITTFQFGISAIATQIAGAVSHATPWPILITMIIFTAISTIAGIVAFTLSRVKRKSHV